MFVHRPGVAVGRRPLLPMCLLLPTTYGAWECCVFWFRKGCSADWCGGPDGLLGRRSHHMPEADGRVNVTFVRLCVVMGLATNDSG